VAQRWRSDTDAMIRRAIVERRLVRFSYHGCVRVAEPHDYGLRRGAEQLLVYQVAGESRSGKLPSWRRVAIAEMSGFELLDRTFAGGREVPSGVHSQWDELYLRVAPAAAPRT
jgi:hypothetical protein